jgi:Raf kinase inhibitor-like YbhB/YbcL family protein
MMFQVRAPAFDPAGDIPSTFACDGADISPALEWTDPPEGTESFALVVEDPDAPRGTWVHWVIYDLPANERRLPQSVEPRATLPSGARQGINDFGRIGYAGPCPPPGPPHRYYFRLFALGTRVTLRARATRAALDLAMRGHVLATAELFGRYQRREPGGRGST